MKTKNNESERQIYENQKFKCCIEKNEVLRCTVADRLFHFYVLYKYVDFRLNCIYNFQSFLVTRAERILVHFSVFVFEY